MDLEVVEAIESLREDVSRVETSLRAEIGNQVGMLRAEMATKTELAALRAEMATKTDLAALREELIRHSHLLYESLHDDIRILAEGFAVLSAKIDRITPPLS